MDGMRRVRFDDRWMIEIDGIWYIGTGTGGRIDQCMHGWMDGWIDGCT